MRFLFGIFLAALCWPMGGCLGNDISPVVDLEPEAKAIDCPAMWSLPPLKPDVATDRAKDFYNHFSDTTLEIWTRLDLYGDGVEDVVILQHPFHTNTDWLEIEVLFVFNDYTGQGEFWTFRRLSNLFQLIRDRTGRSGNWAELKETDIFRGLENDKISHETQEYERLGSFGRAINYPQSLEGPALEYKYGNYKIGRGVLKDRQEKQAGFRDFLVSEGIIEGFSGYSEEEIADEFGETDYVDNYQFITHGSSIYLRLKRYNYKPLGSRDPRGYIANYDDNDNYYLFSEFVLKLAQQKTETSKYTSYEVICARVHPRDNK